MKFSGPIVLCGQSTTRQDLPGLPITYAGYYAWHFVPLSSDSDFDQLEREIRDIAGLGRVLSDRDRREILISARGEELTDDHHLVKEIGAAIAKMHTAAETFV